MSVSSIGSPERGGDVARQTQAKPIGMRMVELGRLNASDIPTIQHAQRSTRLRFGETAVQLGLATRRDVEEALARQHHFPSPPAWVRDTELIIANSSMGRAAEAIRTLRAQLALGWMNQRETQVLSVVSSARGEGRSFIAANLAVAFAQLNERTLLIDLDLRHACMHRIFRVPNDKGLSTLVTGHSSGHEIHHISGYDTLSLLPAGPPSRHPQELLAARSMAPVFAFARTRFDIVIVDTPAWSLCADAQIVSSQADHALLVSAPGRATRDATESLVGALRQVGVSIAGATINRR